MLNCIKGVIQMTDKKNSNCGCGCLTQPKKGSKIPTPKVKKAEKLKN